eukprot:scaffold6847_cov64-Phaeocystis_antarctica.AAC.6
MKYSIHHRRQIAAGRCARCTFAQLVGVWEGCHCAGGEAVTYTTADAVQFPPAPAPRPAPARSSPAPPPARSLTLRPNLRDAVPRVRPKWGAHPWVVASPAPRSSTLRPSLRRTVGTRVPPKREAAAPWQGRLRWRWPRLYWTEPRVPASARPPTLRPSLRRIVHRVPPKWGAAPRTCRARLGWSCRYLGRTCWIRWTCGLSWTGVRVAARGAASLTSRGLVSRSSPCSLHGGRAGCIPPAGRGGLRCGRHRRREGGPGAEHRTTGAPSRPAAAPRAPPAVCSRSSPPPVVACPAPSLHRSGEVASLPSAPRRNRR